jgi:hypothetical protein
MKNIIKLIGIIALVALIGFSFAACDNDTTTTYSLNGTWSTGEATVDIDGNFGILRYVTTESAIWNSVISQGYINIGGQLMKNLSKTGDSIWTGQIAVVRYGGDPNVATGVEWHDFTITMYANGQTFSSYTPATGTTRTWAKVQ